MRKKWSIGLYCLYLAGLFTLFFLPKTVTDLLGNIRVPLGYAVIILVGFLPFLILHFDSKKSTEESENFRLLFAFVSLYTLLFLVAAFGIVWYGIVMYFGFLAIIAYCLEESLDISYAKNDTRVIAVIILLVLCITPYYVSSALPHAWNNLPKDSMEYKLGRLQESEAVFMARPEYASVLSELNLRDPNQVVAEIRMAAKNPSIQEVLAKYSDASLDGVIYLLTVTEQLSTQSQTPESLAIAAEARSLKTLAYKRILHPTSDNKNPALIYRVGTFLTYYVSENRSRFYEDSLINNFDTYIKGATPDISIDNMSKLGLKYILLDLNAATIDRDPRHDLSRRYELMLDLVRSNKLRLISTDSLCLQLGLSLRNDPNYLQVAGVNYNSYVKNEKGEVRAIAANSKLKLCQENLAQIIFEKRVSDTQFPFLKDLSAAVLAKSPSSAEQIQTMIAPYVERSWMAAFEIINTPLPSNTKENIPKK